MATVCKKSLKLRLELNSDRGKARRKSISKYMIGEGKVR